jgi:hypothetical protein
MPKNGEIIETEIKRNRDFLIVTYERFKVKKPKRFYTSFYLKY